MAVRAEAPRRYTYADLFDFPDDHMRREIIDGELFVSPSPVIRHQRSSMAISAALYAYAQKHGGEALAAPMDLKFAEDNVVEPDVMFITAANRKVIGKHFLAGPPDLVVEISSPSTRRLELVRKKELYARSGVPVYWYVDLEAERVEIYELNGERYPAPALKEVGETLELEALPGFSLSVDAALSEEPEPDQE